MPRSLRRDYEGALLHVINRGHAHRPLFDGTQDVNYFLDRLEAQVRAERLKVLAWAILSTHYHLLLERTSEPLAGPFGWVEDLYARYFNRVRERDGHVFKGRYYARLVEDDLYLAHVVNYIDQNAVAAGMATQPDEFEHGSARYYRGEHPPSWMARERVQGLVARIARAREFHPDQYPKLWEACAPVGREGLLERRGGRERASVAPLSVLVRAGPAHVQRWLAENSLKEEGRSAPCLAVPGGVVRSVLASWDPGKLPAGYSTLRVTQQLTAGLLASVSGWDQGGIAGVLGVCRSTAGRDAQMHRQQLRSDPAYAEVAAAVVVAALQAAYGRLAHL